MIPIRLSISQFKAHCTALLREIGREGRMIEVTNHGRVIAVVGPPPEPEGVDPGRWLGSLRGTVLRHDAPESPTTGSGAWEVSFD